jgi:hypothetical protein
MRDLFNPTNPPARSAIISECGLYRYRLARTWDADLRPACFVMLNPSTADAFRDDPTIRRCVGFARRWGLGGIVVVNLFALRAADPRALLKATDPVGPDNDRHIAAVAESAGATVVAWGAHPMAARRVEAVTSVLLDRAVFVSCLGTTGTGQPRHPLFVRADEMLRPFVLPAPKEAPAHVR